MRHRKILFLIIIWLLFAVSVFILYLLRKVEPVTEFLIWVKSEWQIVSAISAATALVSGWIIKHDFSAKTKTTPLYFMRLPEILRDMIKRLEELRVNLENNVPANVNKDILDEIARVLARKPNIHNPKTEDWIEVFYLESNAMDAKGIGLTNAKNSDEQWQKLKNDLEKYRLEITDKQLKDLLLRFDIVLDGINANKLFGIYVDKFYSLQDLRAKSINLGANKGKDYFVEDTYRKILKRIEELNK